MANDGGRVMTDIHLTRLAEWVLRQLGAALLASVLVGVAGGVMFVFTGSPALLAIAYLGGPLVFGLVLVNGSAPMPYDVAELEPSAATQTRPPREWTTAAPALAITLVVVILIVIVALVTVALS